MAQLKNLIVEGDTRFIGDTNAGKITASSIVKSGGTSSQFLKADGSVDGTSYAPLASPSLTGTPTAPTATAGTNTTQIATTAFVQSASIWEPGSTNSSAKLKNGSCTASGNQSVAEGNATVANNTATHAEGDHSKATGYISHAEGYNTWSTGGNGSHSEGAYTFAYGASSHAEGESVVVTGRSSHAEGTGSSYQSLSLTGAAGATTYTNSSSVATNWVGGIVMVADGSACAKITSVSTGNKTITLDNTLSSTSAFSGTSCRLYGGYYGKVTGDYSHHEGGSNNVTGSYSHAEGGYNTASGSYCHVEGSSTIAASYADHAEGSGTEARGSASHAEGQSTHATGYASHAEGWNTTASNMYAHAEGGSTTASSQYSHAEGYNTTASTGYAAHAEGQSTIAAAESAHAEGQSTAANAAKSHAEGYGTQANVTAEHAEGTYNVSYSNQIHSVGIGTSSSARKNAHTITTDGKHYIPGIGTYTGTETTLPAGQDLATIVNNKIPMVSITYSALKTLRDNSQLVPGMQYRITDYNCVTTQPETQSAGHQFDIIVVADSTNKINENARACLHSGDDYFANSNLAAWELKYKLDGDDDLLASIHLQSKLILDSWNGDGSNKFVRDSSGDFSALGSTYYAWVNDENERVYTSDSSGGSNCSSNPYLAYFDSFEVVSSGTTQIVVNWWGDEVTVTRSSQNDFTFNGTTYYAWVNDDYGTVYTESATPQSGNYAYPDPSIEFSNYYECTSVQQSTSEQIAAYKGIIYYMKDEFDNECPYDFKNIQFKRYYITTVNNSQFSWMQGRYMGVRDAINIPNEYVYNIDTDNCIYMYTFDSEWGDVDMSLARGSYYNVISKNNSGKWNNIVFEGNCRHNKINGNNCYNMFFSKGCDDNSFDSNCYNINFYLNCRCNYFKTGCHKNVFDSWNNNNTFGIYNTSVFFGSTNEYNTLGTRCSAKFGNSCSRNNFGNGCNITFGNSCTNNTFGNNCYSTFGNNCGYNKFGNSCNSNNIGDNCNSNNFGNYCNSNNIGNNCIYNTFGNYCTANNIGDYCTYNTFENNCTYNTFGTYCSSNNIGNDCSRIKFGDSSSVKNYYRYITVESGNKYIYLNCTTSTTSSKYYQNVKILSGVNNTTAWKTITDSNVNQTFNTTYQPANSQIISI